MAKYYFLTQGCNLCYTYDYFQDYMIEHSLTELNVFEAKQVKDNEFFFCKEVNKTGSKNEGTCGVGCEKYNPKNHKSGICINYGFCYEPSDDFKTIKLRKMEHKLEVFIQNNVELIYAKDIKALTWKQPFAELMLRGKIETRTWKTKYRGWVLICAAQKPYNAEQLKNICGIKQICRILTKLQTDFDYEGKAIAIAKLTDCRPMTLQDEDKCFVNYYEGLYCHIYENVKPIKPFIFKGKQGFSNITESILKQIKFI